MARTVAVILAQADELAKRFEDFEPGPNTKAIDGAPLRAVREAFEDSALAQQRLAERVSVAKAAGHSWAAIGLMLGTSGEAARQRYGVTASKPPKAGSRSATPRSGAQLSRTARADVTKAAKAAMTTRAASTKTSKKTGGAVRFEASAIRPRIAGQQTEVERAP